MKVIRQGDVALIRIKSIPTDAVLQPPTGNKVILAFGEMTGHHHRFEFVDRQDGVKLYRTGSGERYLEVSAPSDLLHEEHSTARVLPGKYLLPSQVEYTPAALRNVQD
jgi:hypothetical protein